jgi:hypothetical protein
VPETASAPATPCAACSSADKRQPLGDAVKTYVRGIRRRATAANVKTHARVPATGSGQGFTTDTGERYRLTSTRSALQLAGTCGAVASTAGGVPGASFTPRSPEMRADEIEKLHCGPRNAIFPSQYASTTLDLTA